MKICEEVTAQMGSYLNPGNSGFSNMRNDVYVDKTEMISLINQTINTHGI